ncbi:M50 family metallopeptidase [Patescibacteria group bacterium]|nr:M50 family metallopeptidase [Patescibacteria group bacterium]
MLTAIVFIVALGILVLVHEFGHFWVARKFGIRVEEFGFGFPPRLAEITKHGVRYSFNLLPLGGFVKIFGEQGEEENNPFSFASRPAWQRFSVLVAGVLMNVLLAWFLFSLVAGIGTPTAVDSPADAAGVQNLRVAIVGVAPQSPADHAGLRFGDAILRLGTPDNTEALSSITVDGVQKFTDAHAGKEILITVLRGKEEKNFLVLARKNPSQNEGAMGIMLSWVGIARSSWFAAPVEGLKHLWSSFLETVLGLYYLFYDLFTTGRFQGDISGPVGIFMLSGEVWTLGISYFLQLIGILSLNLAILNALPFPALDGGRMFFLAIEKIKGSKVDQSVEHAIHTVGFILLIMLMVAITYRDIARLF